MTYVWGFGVAKPVAGLRPQTVGADEDREGVRNHCTLELMSQLAEPCSDFGRTAPTQSTGAMPPILCSRREGSKATMPPVMKGAAQQRDHV